MSGVAWTTLGSVVVTTIAALAAFATARSNQRAQREDKLIEGAKAYLDEALSYSRGEIAELRAWKDDAEDEMAALHTEVRGLRAEVKRLQRENADLRSDR